MTNNAPALTDPAGLADHLAEQLTWHWEGQLRPRWAGLSDEEYFWEPVAGCWNVRPRGSAPAGTQIGGGDFALDFVDPRPDPTPVTTIAWRIGHIVVGVLAQRSHSHFDGPVADYDDFAYAGSAAVALAQLDEHYARWLAGIRALTLDQLWTPVGPAEGPFAELPMIDLVLHIHREVIHHGAEIALLRDLYAHR